MTKLALAFTSLLVPACAAGPGPEPQGGPATAISCGAADDAVATRLDSQLTGKLAGQLTGDAVACARVIAKTTYAYGLDEHAAQIAIATAIAESSLVDLTRAGESDSAGLFQQHVSQGWGLPDQLTDPTFATNAFLDRMVIDFPDDAWETAPIGLVAQTIQLTAAPDGFQAQADDGAMLAGALWSSLPEDSVRAR